jgi:hypothetical protein
MNLKIPTLRLRYRVTLYLFTIIMTILSLLQASTKVFMEPIGIVFYILGGCGLAISCYYLVVNWKKHWMKERVESLAIRNTLIRRIVSEQRLRLILFTVPGTISNVLFALFNGFIGIRSHSEWFGSLAAYYILLSAMRVEAVNQERRIQLIADKCKKREMEIRVYRKNSIFFIFMAVVLVGMVVLLILSMGGKQYPGLTIYAAAAYTFYRITMSSINVIKMKKRNSPLLMIIRKIGWADALVSVLTLQTAMFTAFSVDKDALVKMMNGATGIVVSLIVLGMGVQGLYGVKK